MQITFLEAQWFFEHQWQIPRSTILGGMVNESVCVFEADLGTKMTLTLNRFGSLQTIVGYTTCYFILYDLNSLVLIVFKLSYYYLKLIT